VRPITEDDFGVLWAAYLRGSFKLPKLTEAQFTEWIYTASQRMRLVGIEDAHRGFKAGRGLVALVSVTSNDGWLAQPVVDFFKWATPKHVLRAYVAFFQYFRNIRAPGVCMVLAHVQHKRLLDRMTEYGVLYFRGKIPFGSPEGHMAIYSIDAKGTKHANG